MELFEAKLHTSQQLNIQANRRKTGRKANRCATVAASRRSSWFGSEFAYGGRENTYELVLFGVGGVRRR